MKGLAILGKLFRLILYILIILIAVAILMVLLFGYKLYCIQTGSMEPEYPVGSMIVVSPVEFGELEVGDVVTFVLGESTIVTHRIVEIDSKDEALTTKGDNNNVADSRRVSFERVIGKVTFHIPVVGYAILLLDTAFGKWMLAIAAVALVGIAIIRRIYYNTGDDEDDEGGDEPQTEDSGPEKDYGPEEGESPMLTEDNRDAGQNEESKQ